MPGSQTIKTPPNKTSLIAEITVPPNQRIDINRLIDEIIQDLIELGVIETVMRSKFLKLGTTKRPSHLHNYTQGRRQHHYTRFNRNRHNNIWYMGELGILEHR